MTFLASQNDRLGYICETLMRMDKRLAAVEHSQRRTEEKLQAIEEELKSPGGKIHNIEEKLSSTEAFAASSANDARAAISQVLSEKRKKLVLWNHRAFMKLHCNCSNIPVFRREGDREECPGGHEGDQRARCHPRGSCTRASS